MFSTFSVCIVTTESEKQRLCKWLRQTLRSGRKLFPAEETQAAADEIDFLLQQAMADARHETTGPRVVNFATQPAPDRKP